MFTTTLSPPKAPHHVFASCVPARSHSKLSKMMIHVQISPPHPVPVGHHPENGMRPPRKIPGLPGKPFQQPSKLSHIRFKFRRPRPANLLIYLWHRFHAVRPTERHIQRRHFHESLPEGPGLGSQCLLSDDATERIAQVAHHLVRGHLSPASLVICPHQSQSRGNLFSVLRNSQGFHSPSLYLSGSILSRICAANANQFFLEIKTAPRIARAPFLRFDSTDVTAAFWLPAASSFLFPFPSECLLRSPWPYPNAA
jgi:hypothetical protein